MWRNMDVTYLLMQQHIDGEELRQIFFEAFETAPKKRSFMLKILLRLLSSTVLRPPSNLDLNVVSKLATMFVMEHLAVRLS